MVFLSSWSDIIAETKGQQHLDSLDDLGTFGPSHGIVAPWPAGAPLFFSKHCSHVRHFLTHSWEVHILDLYGVAHSLFQAWLPGCRITPICCNTNQMLVAYSDAWLLLIARPRPSLKHSQTWLVVSTPLKNISQWAGLSHILWKIKNVWNHQPETLSNTKVLLHVSKFHADLIAVHF